MVGLKDETVWVVEGQEKSRDSGGPCTGALKTLTFHFKVDLRVMLKDEGVAVVEGQEP